MLSYPPRNSLDQGAIFTCATAENYPGCRVHGLVITARCDITQDKVQTYSYIPVVPFQDWLQRDGARILSERASKSARDTMATVLTNSGYSPSILSTKSATEILDVLFPADATDKGIKTARKTFEKAATRLKIAMAFHDSDGATMETRELLSSEEAQAKHLAKELCQNAIAEAYYLPGVHPADDTMGFVALLREIGHIPRALAAGLVEGLDETSYATLCNEHPRCAAHLNFAKEDFAHPVGSLQSPFIEHLMQRLTLLFSRIGVTDVAEEALRTEGRGTSRRRKLLPFRYP